MSHGFVQVLLLPRMVLLVALATLVGCAGPVRTLPAKGVADMNFAVPAEWTASAETPAPAGLPGQRWWEEFGSAGLSSTVQAVLSGNRDLQAAAFKLDQARAVARMVGGEMYPTVGAGYQWSRGRQNFIGLPLPGGGILSNTSTTQGLQMNVSWEADVWGRLRKGRQAAWTDAEMAEAELQHGLFSLAAQAAKLYYTIQELHGLLVITQETRSSYEETQQWIASRYESGLVGSLDLRLASIAVEQVRSIEQAQLNALQSARRALEVLAGRYPANSIELPDEPFPEVSPLPMGLPGELLQRRFDLLAAERRLAATEARVEEARRALYPRISLTASGGTTSEELADLLDQDFRVWNLAANLAQPIFQGGRLRQNVQLRRAQTAEAIQAYAGTMLRAFAEVETALAAEQHLRSQERHLSASLEQAAGARALAEEQYRMGLAPYLVVQDAQRSEFNARRDLLSLQAQSVSNRIDLLLALGGNVAAETAPPATSGPVPEATLPPPTPSQELAPEPTAPPEAPESTPASE